MKNRKMKMITVLVSAFLLTLVFALGVFAAETTNYWVTDNLDVAEYRSETDDSGKYTKAPIKEGYIFAGWFVDEACTEVFTGATGTAYAKFVPAAILGMKAQVGGNLVDDNMENDDNGGAIRFVTSVDSTDYSAVGFEVYYNGSTTNPYVSENTSKVYTHLYAVGDQGSGEPIKYDPTVFHKNSQFFKTLTFKNLPASEYAKSLEAKPFWVTLDGTKVVAEGGVRFVNEGRKYIIVDETAETNGVGTKERPYNSFTDAMKLAISENKTATNDIDAILYLNSNVTANEEFEMKYNKKVVIQSNEAVTITRGDDIIGAAVTGGGFNVFDVNTGTLSIQGTAENPITIEGNTIEESVRSTTANVRAFAVRNGATLDMDYVTVQNFTRNFTADSGGAVIGLAGSTMNFNYCTFNSNYAYAGGGALYIFNDVTVTSTNCTFENNEGSSEKGNGGAIHCKGIFNDTNSTYTGNVGRNGGAIAVMKEGTFDAGQVTVIGATFTENEATSNGNAIFLNSDGCSGNVSGSTFVDNAYVYNDGTKNTNKPYAVYITSGAIVSHTDNTYTKTNSTLQQIVNALGTLTSNDLEAKIDKLYYPAFTTAFSAAASGKTIVLLKDASVTSQQQIRGTATARKTITITCESPVTLSYTGTTAANIFDVRDNAELILGGTSASNMLTLQGNANVDGTTLIRGATVRANSTLRLKYAKLQNFYRTETSQWGAAIYVTANSGTVVAEDCEFISNHAQKGGGAINLVAGASVTCKNSVFKDNSTSTDDKANGGAVRSLGTYIDENNIYINNTAKEGGAVAVMDGTAVMDGKSTGKFSNNESKASNNSNAVYVEAGKTATIQNYILEGYEPATINVLGTLNFNNLQGARLIQSSDGTIKATGTEKLDEVAVVPVTYEVGQTILTVSDGERVDAYDNIQVAANADSSWKVDADGKLQSAKAATVKVGDTVTEYDTLNAAISYAKDKAATITVLRNSQLPAAHTITGNVTIVNVAGKTVNIERAKYDATLLTVDAGKSLTLGTDDTNHGGKLVFDAFTATTATKRFMANKGTFNLKANAVIIRADFNNATAWGSVLINQGTTATANLNGTIAWNQTHSNNAAGVLLNHTSAAMNITGGLYTNNKTNNNGGLVYVHTGTVNVSGGHFEDNYAIKGAVGYVTCDTANKGTLNITGGTYRNNLPSTYYNGKGNMNYNDVAQPDGALEPQLK